MLPPLESRYHSPPQERHPVTGKPSCTDKKEIFCRQLQRRALGSEVLGAFPGTKPGPNLESKTAKKVPCKGLKTRHNFHLRILLIYREINLLP
ncbi:hypothetical protein HQ29_05655 [Porphyromonas canoris]|nr:hypothetical protein HQ29_05655 [Porphyromonas canoris]